MKILSELSSYLDVDKTMSIIDAGSGRTSLGFILSYFKEAMVDAIVYPGDLRKINSIKDNVLENNRYIIIEHDMCQEPIIKSYDLVVAHLLLGEAAKFGNSFIVLFTKLMEGILLTTSVSAVLNLKYSKLINSYKKNL